MDTNIFVSKSTHAWACKVKREGGVRMGEEEDKEGVKGCLGL